MMNEKIKLAVIPVKRGFTSLENALYYKEKIMSSVRKQIGNNALIVDAEDIVDGGILYKIEDISKVTDRLKAENIDGLFMPHCDFGTEEVIGRVAKMMQVPFLLWGNRDKGPDPETGKRTTGDTQCGVLASSKALQRYQVPFSYIVNSGYDSEEFKTGLNNFLRVVSVVKRFNNMRIAQIGNRPRPFMSVMTDENDLLSRFGIEVVPLSAIHIIEEVKEMVSANTQRLNEEISQIKERVDCTAMQSEALAKIAALKLVIKDMLDENNCNAASLECWSLFPEALGIVPCFVVAELTEIGLPVACEMDINGAVTSALLQAAGLDRDETFFADLTIRHPENDNAELLWHCGPFPHSLRDKGGKSCLVEGRGQWGLKEGNITIARFDAMDGQYSLFAGEAKGIKGPKTEGTYLWIEVDDWKKWEEKIVFGPYIHHVVGVYGKYTKVLTEACKYINGLNSDPVDTVELSL